MHGHSRRWMVARVTSENPTGAGQRLRGGPDPTGRDDAARQSLGIKATRLRSPMTYRRAFRFGEMRIDAAVATERPLHAEATCAQKGTRVAFPPQSA